MGCEALAPTATPPTVMYIGPVARQTGASIKAVRLYERMGLLGTVARLGQYRVYNERHIAQIRLIKQAQAMGLSLSAMAAAMRPGQSQPDWSVVAAQVDQRRTEVAQEMARLTAMDRVLRDIAAELRACDASA